MLRHSRRKQPDCVNSPVYAQLETEKQSPCPQARGTAADGLIWNEGPLTATFCQ